MRFWICMNCGLIHSEETPKCGCGMCAFLAQNWVEFASKEALEEWVEKMNEYMGVKLRYAGD